MLKTMLNLNENINMNLYVKLKSFMKLKSIRYQSKKAKVFTPENVQKFCNEASDDQFITLHFMMLYLYCFFFCKIHRSTQEDDITEISKNSLFRD